MESIQSRVFKILLKLIRRKEFWYQSGDALLESIAKRRKLNFSPPASIVDSLQISLHVERGQRYYVINETTATNPMHILYLHGGGYVHRITKFHWHFLKRLATELQCTITVPLYPLAPEHTYEDTFDFVYPLYEKVQTIAGAENTVIMGDSAGGGLAMALVQLSQKNDKPLPKQTIMISPWLDLTLENPDMDEIDPIDPFFAKPGGVEVADMYAGGTDKRHYLLSPINGDLTKLGNIALFVGTHDMLVADARKLVSMMEAKELPITYYEYPKMVHVFPLFPFQEGKQAFSQILELLKE